MPFPSGSRSGAISGNSSRKSWASDCVEKKEQAASSSLTVAGFCFDRSVRYQVRRPVRAPDRDSLRRRRWSIYRVPPNRPIFGRIKLILVLRVRLVGFRQRETFLDKVEIEEMKLAVDTRDVPDVAEQPVVIVDRDRCLVRDRWLSPPLGDSRSARLPLCRNTLVRCRRNSLVSGVSIPIIRIRSSSIPPQDRSQHQKCRRRSRQ